MSEMQTAIKQYPKFETDIRDEQLRVLETSIPSIYTHVRARYPHSTLAETLPSLFNIQKIKKDKLVDFIKRFDQEKQLAKNKLGKHCHDLFVGNTIEHNASTDKAEKTSIKSEAFE